ncbi:response regulator transcription factor [Niabella sp.]|uniref:response regulator n=1 Tax=Niabella sp. TaxID=1962976 RepID=UPI0026147EEE|nr:response regulator transcription factor [Niabella sp.]
MIYTVFIVDDHHMVIEGIRSLLGAEKEIEWAGHATTAASCLAFLQRQLPDVILMDINLPDGNGMELCKEVRRLYPSVFVIGLSTFSQQSFIQKMMENGASGYVLKNATKEALLEAIRDVAKGKVYLSEEASQAMRKDNIPAVVLTRREQEVLALIAEGFTNNEMAQRLFVSVATVDTHRKNLLTKLDAKNTAALVRKAVQLALI